MNRCIFLLVFFFSIPHIAAGAEKTIFGPVEYDVKERYGMDNVYKDDFAATEGVFAIKIENPKANLERPEFIEFKLNGESVLKDGKYDYPFIACIVRLQKKNSFELVLKDAKPSGFKRPPLPPRFVTMTVMPFAGRLPGAAYGVSSWESLGDIADLLQKIKNPDSASLALTALNLENDVATRAEAVRKLAGRRDTRTQSFLEALYHDFRADPEIRGETAVALGMLGAKSSIQSLISGMLDPDEKARLGCARALSLYNEEDTREPLTEMLLRLDVTRRDAVINSMAHAGWKPLGALMTLAESDDPYISSTAVGILGSSREPRATQLLLKLLEEPGRQDIKQITAALAETRDQRAIEVLEAVAKDPIKRTGKEAELAEAFVSLGDRKWADLIAEMLKASRVPITQFRLKEAYRKLTGREYK